MTKIKVEILMESEVLRALGGVMDKIKELLKSEEYEFLRSDEHLNKNIILLTLGGSHAYGTNVSGSDLDIRGIAVERPKEIIGMSSFEQFEDRKTDTVIYGLKKVILLLQNCNPNVIEMLGTREDQLIVCNKYGRLLRDNLDLFLSQKAIQSFGGYATAQLRRLQNALARENYPQKEKEKHILNSIENQMNSIEDRYRELNNGKLELFLDKSLNFKETAKRTELQKDHNYKKIEKLIMEIYKDVILNGN